MTLKEIRATLQKVMSHFFRADSQLGIAVANGLGITIGEEA